MTELAKAQKAIDRCNKKCGCNSYCNESQKAACELLRRHNQLISEKAKQHSETIKEDNTMTNTTTQTTKHTILSGCGFVVEFNGVISAKTLKTITAQATSLIIDLKASYPELFDKPQAEPLFIEAMSNILFCEWLDAKVTYSTESFIIFENLLRDIFQIKVSSQ